MIKILQIASFFFAATIAGFSQAPAPAQAPTPTPVAATGTILPIARTLTSNDGRTIDVTILAKTATAIRAARADGKEFEITLDKLSDADRAFVAGLTNAPAPPVKKPRLLFIGHDIAEGSEYSYKVLLEKLKAAGFEIRIETSVSSKTPEGTGTTIWPGIDNMTNDEIKAYDVIWEAAGPRERLLILYPTFRGVMVMKSMGDQKIQDFLAYKEKSIYGGKPYVKVNDNLVRYDDRVTTWKGQKESSEKGPCQPEFLDQAIVETKKLLQGKSGVPEKPDSKTKRVLYVMEHALIYDRRIMAELEKDGHEVTVAWDNENKPLPHRIKPKDKQDSFFPVPTKRQFIRPEEATAKGFDAVCIGTTTILTPDTAKMEWSQKYIDLMREADGLGLVVLVNSLDDYSKKQILSGIPKKTGKTETTNFLKTDENFIIYNRQLPESLEMSPEDPSPTGTIGIDGERRATFNALLKN